MSSSVPIDNEEVDVVRNHWKEEINIIKLCFFAAKDFEQIILLKRLRS